MKNLFRTGLLALVITTSITSCGSGDKATTKTPIDSPNVQIDTTKKPNVKAAIIDSAKKDTAKK